jgi:hypothetical protein
MDAGWTIPFGYTTLTFIPPFPPPTNIQFPLPLLASIYTPSLECHSRQDFGACVSDLLERLLWLALDGQHGCLDLSVTNTDLFPPLPP